MKLTKTAHVETMKKIAEVEQYDRAQAFEVGFAKAAHDAGLDEKQYNAMYAIAQAKINGK